MCYNVNILDIFGGRKTVKNAKKILAIVLILSMIASCGMFSIHAANTPALEGLGTEESPYLIKDAGDIVAMREFVNSQSGDNSFYKLNNDIDLKGDTISEVIGTSASNCFSGTFDGAGYTISNFKLTSQGFFGHISNATIKDLSLTDVTATFSTAKAGILARQGANVANAVTSINNCHVQGTISSSVVDVAGLVGITQQKIEFENCSVDVDINCTANQKVGGLIARALSEVSFTDCVSSGSITATSATQVGGFVGSLNNTSLNHFTGCANLMEISVSKDGAGFVGHAYSSEILFDKCYNAGDIIANASATYSVFIAQFVARSTANSYSDATIGFEDCYVLGDVKLENGKTYISSTNASAGLTGMPINNFTVIAYGGSGNQHVLEADRFGNTEQFTLTNKAGLFDLAAKGEATVFHGLGDVVTVGYQEAIEPGVDGKYDTRIIAAVSSLDPAGFKITATLGDVTKTSEVSVKFAYSSIMAAGKTYQTPNTSKYGLNSNYYFITLVVEDFTDNHKVTYTPYSKNTTNIAKTAGKMGLYYVGTYDLDDGHTMNLYEGVTESMFHTRCAEIVSEGYSLYSENNINGSLFKTYTKNDQMTHIYWAKDTRELREISASTTMLPIDSSNDKNVCTPVLYQLSALNDNKTDGGMGFILRLHDGRFIVVDGGYTNEDSANEIYNKLYELAIDKNNIVIATWLLTHAHGDHYGALWQFAEMHAAKTNVTLESVMLNTNQAGEIMKYGESSRDYVDRTILAYEIRSGRDVAVYKPLTGQVYKFAKTSITILYTMSDFAPNTVILNECDASAEEPLKSNTNIQTMPSIIDVDTTKDDNGDKIFIMGDMTSFSCNILCNRYGNALKSDIVQVSHHGHAIDLISDKYARRDNSTKEIYSFIDPDIAFWPTARGLFESRLLLPTNAYLDTLVDKHIVASDADENKTIEFD